MAAQSGEPDIAPSGGIKLIALLESLELTRNAAPLLAEACVQRLEADEERCRRHAEESMSLATMASAVRGYADGARLVRTAWGAGLTCREAAVREGLFSPDAARELFDVRTLTDRPRMERLIRADRRMEQLHAARNQPRGAFGPATGPVPLRRPDAGQQAYL